MGNTPCAHAVDSVLHQRVEIKTTSRRPHNTFHYRPILDGVERGKLLLLMVWSLIVNMLSSSVIN